MKDSPGRASQYGDARRWPGAGRSGAGLGDPAADGDSHLASAVHGSAILRHIHAIKAVAAVQSLARWVWATVSGVISTDRLDLRVFTSSTAAAVASGTPRDQDWADGFPREDDQDAARMYLRAPHAVFGSWFITERATGQVIGTIGFFGPPDAEGLVMVGYGLVEQARQRGYATEALRALVGYALVHRDVRQLAADCDLENVASHRVLLKAGFDRAETTDTAQWFRLTTPTP